MIKPERRRTEKQMLNLKCRLLSQFIKIQCEFQRIDDSLAFYQEVNYGLRHFQGKKEGISSIDFAKGDVLLNPGRLFP